MTDKDWGKLVESSLLRASTRPSGRAARVSRLNLAHSPTPFYCEGVSREIALVPDPLRKLFRKAATEGIAWPLYLYGPAGTGKTCAVLALHDHAGGVYYSHSQFGAEAVLAMKGQLEWPWRKEQRMVSDLSFWKAIANCTLLTIDDVGTRADVSDAAYDRFKRALDCREGKPTVVVSNFPLDVIAKIYDDRVASRLAAGTVEHIFGPDRRLDQ